MALASDLVQIGIPSREADFLGDTANASLALAGVNQANATLITASINRIGSGTAGSAEGARLPAISSVKWSAIHVHSSFIAFTASIYPASGEDINGAGANVPYALTAGAGVSFYRVSSGGWISVP